MPWRSLTSTPAFLLEHRHRQPSHPIVDGRGRPASFVVVREAGAHQQLWPFLPGSEHRSQDCIKGACDGFLVVSLGNQFYICNPVICKRAVLPQPQKQHNTIAGFYCHHSTGEYRVLWVSQSLDLSKTSLYVLTVGSDKPRHVRVRMPLASSPSVEQKLLKEMRFSSNRPPPVHHRGSLLWCPYGAINVGGVFIVFDTEAESFRLMRGPTQQCHRGKLFNMEGTLAFWGGSTPMLTSIDVWAMQDYEAKIWAFKYRIDLSTVKASRQLYSASSKKKRIWLFNDMDVLNERELLIVFNKDRVLCCDIDGKFLGIENQCCMLLTHHRLQESIVPIPGHEVQDDEEPLFSTGHV